MSVSLKDLQLAQRALRRQCRMHPGDIAATCSLCHDAAKEQLDAQWLRERRRAHREYEGMARA